MILRAICQFLISASRQWSQQSTVFRCCYSPTTCLWSTWWQNNGQFAQLFRVFGLPCSIFISYFLFYLCHRDIHKWFTIADNDTSFYQNASSPLILVIQQYSHSSKILISFEHSDKEYKVKSENLYRWWYIGGVEVSNRLEDMKKRHQVSHGSGLN